jgi:hypothetical protein
MTDYPTLHLDIHLSKGTACSKKGYGSVQLVLSFVNLCITVGDPVIKTPTEWLPSH